MSAELKDAWNKVIHSLEDNFDPHAGRKLYRRFCKQNLQAIKVHCLPYHLFAGPIPEGDLDNWQAKVDTLRPYGIQALGSEGKYDKVATDFIEFLKQEDTFTYSVLFLVKGTKAPA